MRHKHLRRVSYTILHYSKFLVRNSIFSFLIISGSVEPFRVLHQRWRFCIRISSQLLMVTTALWPQNTSVVILHLVAYCLSLIARYLVFIAVIS